MLILCLWLLIFLWCLSQKKEWKTAENGSTNQARQFQEDEVCAGQRPVPFTNRKGSFSEGETGLSPLKRSYYETTIRSVFSSRIWRAFRWAAFFFPSSSSSSSSCPARDKSCPLSFSRFTGGGRGVSINGENRWHLKPRERVAVFFFSSGTRRNFVPRQVSNTGPLKGERICLKSNPEEGLSLWLEFFIANPTRNETPIRGTV